MYAVEKNPNAIVTLDTLNREEWNNQVTVVSSDMRVYEAPEKADILVSNKPHTKVINLHLFRRVCSVC